MMEKLSIYFGKIPSDSQKDGKQYIECVNDAKEQKNIW